MEDILIPISFFLALFAILYVYWTTRTKERLALIEKGQTAGIFKKQNSNLSLIKWGIFLIALGLGVVTGLALSAVINEVVAYFTGILILGGIGLVIAYWIISKIEKQNNAE